MAWEAPSDCNILWFYDLLSYSSCYWFGFLLCKFSHTSHLCFGCLLKSIMVAEEMCLSLSHDCCSICSAGKWKVESFLHCLKFTIKCTSLVLEDCFKKRQLFITWTVSCQCMLGLDGCSNASENWQELRVLLGLSIQFSIGFNSSHKPQYKTCF